MVRLTHKLPYVNSNVLRYGEPTYTIARQVITRGAQNVPQLELHPPYFQAHLLVSELSSDNDSPPSRFTISCKATLADLYQKLASLFNLPPESIFRVWTTDNAADFEGVNVMAQKFTDRGQLFPASSEENSLNKLIQDSLLTSGDKLVVEVCEGNSWLLNESDTRTSDATVDEMELAGEGVREVAFTRFCSRVGRSAVAAADEKAGLGSVGAVFCCVGIGGGAEQT